MKKFLTAILLITMLMCLFTYPVSAATTSNSNANTPYSTRASGSDTTTLTITRSWCNVRSGAGANTKWLGKTYSGNTYKVLGKGYAPNKKLWYKIQYTSSKVGWVCSSFVKINTKNSNTVKPKSSNHGALIGTFQSTAYCLCECGGSTRTANGYNLAGKSRTQAMTIAVDRRIIPLGTRVYVEFPAPYQHFSGYYTARDTGGAIRGYIIDLYMGVNNIREANQFGRRYGVKVYYG